MPRRARIVAAGYPMHVILRGIDRAAVFFADDDRRFLLDSLGTVAGEETVAVHAYVLMTNHCHLLMTAARDDGVAAVMKRVGQRYVQHINRTYRRSGGLFEGRFRSSLIFHCFKSQKMLEHWRKPCSTAMRFQRRLKRMRIRWR